MKKFHLAFTEKARRDLVKIWEYIYTVSDDIDTAHESHNRIIAFSQQTLVCFPEIGVKRDHIQSGIRFFPIGNFGIYYFFNNEEVLVVHVLNQSQNI